MAQARKKRKPVKSSTGFTLTGHGIGMLLAGVVIGSLGTVMWQGMNSDDSEVGAGIRKMMESSRRKAEEETIAQPAKPIVPEPQSTNYDFFTVLPEIEVVVGAEESTVTPPVKITPPNTGASAVDATAAASQSETSEPVVSEALVEPAKPSSAYMLQAGSYNRQADAERQKANLGLMGLSSSIQKVTIQGRGDFFRVRLGPYVNHAQMVDVDERLRQEGIRALRLKISRSG
ncbi:MAG: SPOR domain-containing protein [Granulosicoccus sp.]|nr:SPOR domain-containing protein [Granulosicoccus sp.]